MWDPKKVHRPKNDEEQAQVERRATIIPKMDDFLRWLDISQPIF